MDRLADLLRREGFSVWAGRPRDHVGSCRVLADAPEEVPGYVERGKEFVESLRRGGYDAVIFDRSAVTVLCWLAFEKRLFDPERLHRMLEPLYCDINIVLRPDLETCIRRTAGKRSSHMPKTPDYWSRFWSSLDGAVSFLRGRLGPRLAVFEDSGEAADWAFGLVRRLRTHVDLHLTNRCPLECPTCCFAASAGTPVEERLADRAEEVVEAALSLGIREFHLMGGEPLLLGHRLVEIARCIKERGGAVHLVTSGCLDDCGVLEHVDAVFVSVDGPPEVHDGVRGAPVFGRAAEFMRRAKTAGVRLRVGTLVTALNAPVADRVPEALWDAGVGFDSICWMHMSPTGGEFAASRGGGCLCPEANALSPREWLAFAGRLSARHGSLPGAKVELAFSRCRENLGCELLFGKRRLLVMADGAVYLCPMLAPLPPQARLCDGRPAAEVLAEALAQPFGPRSGDPCGEGCWGGCPGYALLFGDGMCDARCGRAGGRLPGRLRIPPDLEEAGFRPACPCRTLPLGSVLLGRELAGLA